MSHLEIIAAAALAFAVLAFLFMASGRLPAAKPLVAMVLAVGFGAFTLVTAAQEGAEVLWQNQTTSLWGVQLWLDLLLCALIGFWSILPRARRQGMNVALWTLFVIASLSVGLLAMVARLLWLEGRAQA